MKKFVSVICAVLILLSVFACAESETRTSVITVEGIEEEITETLHVSEGGYSLWYQADKFLLNTAEDQTHLFAIDSTPEGVEIGIGTSAAYLLVVPIDIAYEDTDAFLMEATGGFDPSVAVIGEPASETLENGIEIKTVTVTEEATAFTYYIVTNGEKVLCVSAICPIEALEGFGARFYDIVKTIEF